MLNGCVTLNEDGHEHSTQSEYSIDSDVNIDREDNIGHGSINSGVEYNYTYLSDEHASQGDTESAETVTCQSSDNHVLKWMVCNSYQRHTQRGNFYSLRCF